MKSKSMIAYKGSSSSVARGARRFGYGVAVVINLVLIWVVQNIVEWDVIPFLTEEFAEVVPITTFSLVVSALFNLVFMIRDTGRLKSAMDLMSTAVAFAVVVRTYQVFPFEFQSEFWDGTAHVLMVIVMVALVAAVIAQLVQLIKPQPKG